MILAIRHFPDRKRPCIVLEEGNQCLVIGYLTDGKREKWLRKATETEPKILLALKFDCPFSIEQILEDKENEE